MKIGLVPISAKPYHAGHHWLVNQAAEQNDMVLLFVSTSDRTRKGEFPIYGDDMRKVWLTHLEPIMPANVEIVYGGSPVQKVYKTLEEIQPGSESIYTVYSDVQDTVLNYPLVNREKYFPVPWGEGQVHFAAEENPALFTRGSGAPNISGSKARDMLKRGDIEAFKALMPSGVNATDVFNALGGSVSEAYLREYIGTILRF